MVNNRFSEGETANQQVQRPEETGHAELVNFTGQPTQATGQSEGLIARNLLPVVEFGQETYHELLDDATSLGDRALEYTREHPVDAFGYAAGALVGGVVGAFVAPELGIAATIGAVSGAGLLDAGIWGSKIGISHLASESD